jgi:antitoxin YefM
MALLPRQDRCPINVPLRRATTGQPRPLAASQMPRSGSLTGLCGHPSKLVMRVRFPSPAPTRNPSSRPVPPKRGRAIRKPSRSVVPDTCLCHATLISGLPVGGHVYAVCGLTAADILVKLLTMTTLPLGEVKTHLSELVGRVHDHHERVTVTVHGHPSAVLVAVEDLERLEETLAILRDAETMRRLAESDAELARGEEVTAAELSAAMRNRSAHE